jgi:hypothetical protein
MAAVEAVDIMEEAVAAMAVVAEEAVLSLLQVVLLLPTPQDSILEMDKLP